MQSPLTPPAGANRVESSRVYPYGAAALRRTGDDAGGLGEGLARAVTATARRHCRIDNGSAGRLIPAQLHARPSRTA